jgi:hypothetical protein
MARCAVIALLSLLTTGCWALGFPGMRSAPAGPPPGIPPTPVVPAVYLEYAGTRVTSLESSWDWRTSSGSSGVNAPSSPGTLLSVPAGSSIDIRVAYAAWPAVLWVAELNGSGVPTAASAFMPTSNAVSYTVTTTGRYRLQVMAEWSYQEVVTHVFELEVIP